MYRVLDTVPCVQHLSLYALFFHKEHTCLTINVPGVLLHVDLKRLKCLSDHEENLGVLASIAAWYKKKRFT